MASSRVETWPVNTAASISPSKVPSSGPGSIPSSAASSSPRIGRARGARATPGEGLGDHLAGQLEMGVDCLLAGALTLGGEPVGDREHGDVDGVRLGGPQVVVHLAARERPLVNEEAEPQVVAGQARQVVGQAPARPQTRAEPADKARAGLVVADEQHPASLADRARLRLAEVVDQGGAAQRIAPGELVGERLGEQLANVGGRGAHERLQIALDLDQPRQHLHGVPVDVEVVVRVLLDAAKRLELRQQDRGRPKLVQELQRPHRVVAREHQAQLREPALPSRLRRSLGLPPGKLHGVVVDFQPEAGGDPGPAHDPERVVHEAARGDGPQPAPLQVGEPAIRVKGGRCQVGERDRDRVDREVAQGEVGLDSVGAQPGDVDVPGSLPRQDAPARELLGQLERGPRGGAADLAGDGPLVSGHRQVDVLNLPAEGGVADGPADDPGFLRRAQSGLAGANGRSRGQPLLDRGAHGPGERTCARGTRGEIPQVIS